MKKRHALTDEQWERMEFFLPGREGYVGQNAKDNRLFVEAVVYRYRTGVPWRDLPERFGDPLNIRRRHARWAHNGVWERVFNIISADNSGDTDMIDSTVVRAHQHSAGAIKKKMRMK